MEIVEVLRGLKEIEASVQRLMMEIIMSMDESAIGRCPECGSTYVEMKFCVRKDDVLVFVVLCKECGKLFRFESRR